MPDSRDCLDRSDRMSLRSPECPTDDFCSFAPGIILGFNADAESFAAYGIVEEVNRIAAAAPRVRQMAATWASVSTVTAARLDRYCACSGEFVLV